VGRRTDDILRIVGALQSGGLCAENWAGPVDTIDPARLLSPGFVLGHYLVEKAVGSGRFATVFRARDLTLDRVVALKVFRPGAVAAGGGVLAEARSAAALSHPNVCTIFAVEETLGYPVIAMEYVSGMPLSDLLARSRFETGRAAEIGRQVASGMAAAHARGVVHGDLKPENVIVGDSDLVKILDFGLARRRPAGLANASAETVVLGPADTADTGGLFGTPSYFSPEQANGEPASEASDVFALGLLLFEMLTGRKAFLGGTLLETLEQVRNADPLALAAEVPAPFSPVIRRALHPHPSGLTIDMAGIAVAIVSGDPDATDSR
jgi:serine/threonine protein kinase